MILDKHLEFSLDQAITVAAASTNSIDLKAAGHLGTGAPMYVIGRVSTVFTDTHAVTVQLEAHEDDSFGAHDDIGAAVTIPATSAVGTKFCIPIPPGTNVKRYIRLYYTPADTITGGVDAWLSNEPWADEAIYPDAL